uniref:Secreted protein n=1 Tax=Echinococcus canadensis TaxID=519352 RepID=A0A915ETF9_9CEST
MLGHRLITVTLILVCPLKRTLAKICKGAFDFKHSTSYPQEMAVNGALRCNLSEGYKHCLRHRTMGQQPTLWLRILGIEIRGWFVCVSGANRAYLNLRKLRVFLQSACAVDLWTRYFPQRRLPCRLVLDNNKSILLTCHKGYVSDYKNNGCCEGSRALVVSHY